MKTVEQNESTSV